MDAVLDKTGRLNSSVEVGKFTALVLNVTNYVDGVAVPSAANASLFVGVAQESILPDGFNDYSAGVYQITSGTAWPTNVNPPSSLGRGVSYRMIGISRAVAASAIASGDHVNIADSAGRFKTVNESAGVTVNDCGFALSPALAANDVFRMFVLPTVRKV